MPTSSFQGIPIQLKQLIEAVNQLMAPPDPPKGLIGFVTSEDNGKRS